MNNIKNSRLKEIFANFQDKKVLVVGDVMLDRYLSGSANRISPEAPVPILDLKSSEEKPGGAANVAVNINGLGAHADIFTILGKDEEGLRLKSIIKNHKIGISFTPELQDRCTTLKTRVMAGSQHLLRVDREDKSHLNKDEIQIIMEAIRNIDWSSYDLVILQDYNKGFLNKHTIPEIIKQAKSANCHITCDPKVENFNLYKGINLIKPNLTELKTITHTQILPNKDELQKISSQVLKDLSIDTILVTLSEHGIFGIRKHEIALQPAVEIEIADVCGAGDAVISICSLASLTDTTLDELLILGNKAGSIVCMHMGVYGINHDDFIKT